MIIFSMNNVRRHLVCIKKSVIKIITHKKFCKQTPIFCYVFYHKCSKLTKNYRNGHYSRPSADCFLGIKWGDVSAHCNYILI